LIGCVGWFLSGLHVMERASQPVSTSFIASAEKEKLPLWQGSEVTMTAFIKSCTRLRLPQLFYVTGLKISRGV